MKKLTIIALLLLAATANADELLRVRVVDSTTNGDVLLNATEIRTCGSNIPACDKIVLEHLGSSKASERPYALGTQVWEALNKPKVVARPRKPAEEGWVNPFANQNTPTQSVAPTSTLARSNPFEEARNAERAEYERSLTEPTPRKAQPQPVQAPSYMLSCLGNSCMLIPTVQ